GLGDLLAIQNNICGLPAESVAGAFGQADCLFAILGLRTAFFGLAGTRRLGHAPQSRIFAQAADDYDTYDRGPLQKGSLGVGTIADNPQLFPEKTQPTGQPDDQIAGHFQLGLELDSVQPLQQGNLLLPHVQQSAQGQSNWCPSADGARSKREEPRHGRTGTSGPPAPAWGCDECPRPPPAARSVWWASRSGSPPK